MHEEQDCQPPSEGKEEDYSKLGVRPRRRPRLYSESSTDDGMENLVPLELEDLRRFKDHLLITLDSAERHMPLLRVDEVDNENGDFQTSPDIDKSNLAKRRWRGALKSLAARKDPWSEIKWDKKKVENALRHRYNPLTKKWKEEYVVVKMEEDTFGKGAMRECFRMKKLSNFSKNRDWNKESNNYVAKSYIEEVSRETYFQDVKLQMDAKLWGEEFNRHNPPKKVDIFMMAVLEFHERNDRPLFHIEHFIEGEYIKYNSNSGYVEENRQTPHAFSHFTFERSGHEIIVVDIQGVGDLYTDPQIHTADGLGYGDGNLGTKGMALFFQSHRCNNICKSLGLYPFDMTASETEEPVKRQRQISETVVNEEKLMFCESPTELDKEDFSSFFRRRHNSDMNMDIEAAKNAAKLARRQRRNSDYFSIEEACSPLPDEDEVESLFSETSSALSWLPRRRRMTESSDDSGIVSSKDMGNFHETSLNKTKPANVDFMHQRDMIPHDDRILGQIHLDLAKYYELGRFSDNTDQMDHEAALFHLKCAADCGLVDAMKNLAFMYYDMPHDILEGLKVAEAGTDEGRYLGFHYMEEAAKIGDRSCMVFVARCYDRGDFLDFPERRSMKTAIDWYEKICEIDMDQVDKTDWGLDDAPYSLIARQAEIWLEGTEDVQSDPKLARDLFTMAAESAMNCMRGKLANKYYMLAEEAYARLADEED